MAPPSDSPLILALDTPDLDTALAWSDAAGEAVDTVKVGLELWSAAGPAAVRALTVRGRRVMLDLKLHDIPNTVASAVRVLAPLGVDLLTVHASGGAPMIRAAVDAADGRLTITAVTVLTSLAPDDLTALGHPPADEAVPRLACLAADAGAGAIVCSPLEAAAVRAAVPDHVRIICPGVRPGVQPGVQPGVTGPPAVQLGVRGQSTPAVALPEAGVAPPADDQRRVLGPAAAVAAGADALVVGRPVTRAPDPAAAARAITAEILAARAELAARGAP